MDLRFTDEQEMIRKTVRRIMQEKVAPRAAEIDQKAELPMDVFDLFKANDIFSLVAAQEYGGFDGKLLTLCLAIEEISRVCASSSMVLGNQSLGSAPIALWGNEAQKAKYLPGIATSEIKASFALTEPNAGSDVGGMQTRAVFKDNRFVINGNKCFITHADIADILTVFAKVEVNGQDKITAFLVDGKAKGVTVGKKEDKMGLRGSSTCSISFEDVEVPESSIVGKIGDGYRIALDCLDKGRIMCGSQSVGLAQGALEAAASYAKTRVQFGKPISENQGIQFILADMATEIELARTMVRAAAWKYDNHEPDMMKFSAMSKLFATDMVMRATTNAVQILGGYGYCKDYPVERMMRDAKIFAIFEGSNQIQRLVIARSLLK